MADDDQESVSDEESPTIRDIGLAALSVLLMMGGLFAAAVLFTVRAGQWRGLAVFIGGERGFSLTGFLLGMVPGFTFGFVDQMGLWTSVWASEPMTFSEMLAAVLSPILPKGELTRQGWGNLVSGVVGTFCAIMVTKIVVVTSGRDEFPPYAEVSGVFLGCLTGIYIPRLLTGRA